MSLVPINSLIHQSSTEDEIRRLDEEQRRSYEHLRNLRAQVVAEAENLERGKRMKAALLNHQKSTPQPSSDASSPSSHQRGKYQPISADVKALIVQKLFYERSLSWDETARTFNVSQASISRILAVEKKRKHGGGDDVPPPKKKSGRKSIIEGHHLVALLDVLEDDSTKTLEELALMLKDRFSVGVSTSAVDDHLAKMEITWKNVLPIPTAWNTPEVIEKRVHFVGNTVAQFSTFSRRPWYFTDQQGFHLHTRKGKGRALAGHSAVLSLAPKGPRVNLCATLGENGIVHWELINSLGEKKRGVNAHDMASYIRHLAVKVPRGSILVFDNAQIHHSQELDSTWEMIAATYQIQRIFLPPYSPFLNPIEYYFNTLKANIKNRSFGNRGELIEVLKELIPDCTAQKAQSYFDKSRSYYRQCAMGMPFRGKILEPESYLPPDDFDSTPSVMLPPIASAPQPTV